MNAAKFLVLAIMAMGVTATAPASPTLPLAQTPANSDAQLQADITKALGNKRWREVTIKVQDGAVTLTGTTQNFFDKQEAGKKAQKIDRGGHVDNQIQVSGGAEVSDQVLFDKLSSKLATDRVGYGTTIFNAITVRVQNGVVTLGGVVYGPPDKDSAIALVSTYPGVKDLVDHIQVAPTSPNDDRIRRAVAQSIYSYATFTKYGIDPAKPIRIIVENGNVTLVGAVDSKADHDVAALRANTVGGVFKVTNDLQYPGQTNER